jgi:hypothetical protein
MSSHTVSTCIYWIYIYMYMYIIYIYTYIIGLISISCHIRWFCCRIHGRIHGRFSGDGLYGFGKAAADGLLGSEGAEYRPLAIEALLRVRPWDLRGLSRALEWEDGRAMEGPLGFHFFESNMQRLYAIVGVVILCYSSIFFLLPLPSLQDVLHGRSEGTVGTQTCRPMMEPQLI